MIHLWAGIVSLEPYQISQLSGMTTTESMLVWVALSIFALVILYHIMGSPYSCSSRHGEWEVLKAVTIAAAA